MRNRTAGVLTLILAGTTLIWAVGCAGPAPAPDQVQQDSVVDSPNGGSAETGGSGGVGGTDISGDKLTG